MLPMCFDCMNSCHCTSHVKASRLLPVISWIFCFDYSENILFDISVPLASINLNAFLNFECQNLKNLLIP